MRRFGPLWALAFTLDRDLLFLILATNLLFSSVAVALFFSKRPKLDSLFIGFGIFFSLSSLSLLLLTLLAGTPIRGLEIFSLD